MTVARARLRGLLREHWLFCLVFVAATLVRAAMQSAFGPALFYLGDSFDYLEAGYGLHLDQGHPWGYPLILAVLALPGRSLAVIAIAQHLAGLVTGVLVYALLLRLRVHRVVAAAAAALVLLNSYTVVLEQHVMAESFFTLALMASVYLVITRTGPVATAGGGLLLGAATLVRAAGIFAAPVWFAYVVWKRRVPRAIATAALAVAFPIVGYASISAGVGGGFGLTEWGGWLLYGRVAAIADCRLVDVPAETRALCETPQERAGRRARRWKPSNYVFDSDSPAHRLYGPAVTAGPSPALRRFALAVIRDRPLEYGRIVARDLTYYFRPASLRTGFDPGIILHEQLEPADLLQDAPTVRRYFPGYRVEKHPPVRAVVEYNERARPPRPLLAALLLSALLSLVLALVGRGRPALPRQRESTFLALLALALVVGPTAVVELNLRFLVPVLPLIACAGALALSDLGALAAVAWRKRRGGHARPASIAH